MSRPELELTFLGTGTSSTLPAIACLTDPSRGCVCCRSTIKGSNLFPDNQGAKNVRRNTSAMVRVRHPGQDADQFILVDCGKSFYASALDHFPSKGFRHIDAVLITHPHADAINGLDDLRSWTLHGAIQKSIKIYCNQVTFSALELAFPYLTQKHMATGGGDVPEFEWHIFTDGQPFEACGVTVLPAPVHHGMHFTDKTPYLSLAFLFERDILYMSDVSHFPEASYHLIEEYVSERRIPLLVIDTLTLAPHSSHFGIGQTMQTVQRLNATRSYTLGFAHRVSHQCWLNLYTDLSKRKYLPKPPGTAATGTPFQGHPLAHEAVKYISSHVEEDFDMWRNAGVSEVSRYLEEDDQGTAYWIRPAYDGLTCKVYSNGTVRDDDDDVDAPSLD